VTTTSLLLAPDVTVLVTTTAWLPAALAADAQVIWVVVVPAPASMTQASPPTVTLTSPVANSEPIMTILTVPAVPREEGLTDVTTGGATASAAKYHMGSDVG